MKLGKIALTLIVLWLAYFLSKQTGFLALLTDISQLQQWIANFGAGSYVVFLLIAIFGTLILLPTSVFAIVSGILFGQVLGGVFALLAYFFGAVVNFVCSRYLFRKTFENLMGNNRVFKKIDQGVNDNGISFIMLTRLVPVFPYALQNYAYGLTGIDIKTYAIVSFLAMAPEAFILAYLAGDIAVNGISIKLLFSFALVGILLFLVSLIAKHLVKKKNIS